MTADSKPKIYRVNTARDDKPISRCPHLSMTRVEVTYADDFTVELMTRDDFYKNTKEVAGD
jgi:hypothetical protein